MSPGSRRGRARASAFPDAEALLPALTLLAEGLPAELVPAGLMPDGEVPDGEVPAGEAGTRRAADVRADLVAIAYRLLFAELAVAAGVPVATDVALADLELAVLDLAALADRLDPARALLFADPGWVQTDVTGLGRLHEHLLAWQPVVEGGRWTWRQQGRLRKAGGVYFTPPALVDHLLDQVLEPLLGVAGPHRHADPSPSPLVTVVDPACGAGAFLLRASRRLTRWGTAAGSPPVEARRRAHAALHGIDLDPAVLELARISLWLDPLTAPGACAPAGPPVEAWTAASLMTDVRLVAGDALGLNWRERFPDRFEAAIPGAGFDVVVGNPPFANQLERLTVRDRAARRAGDPDRDGRVAAYTDLSAVFLLRSLDWVRPGGRIGLVQPQSVLSVRDAAPVRRAVTAAGALTSLWAGESGLFDAAVPTCAVVIAPGVRQGLVRRRQGAEFAPLVDRHVAPGDLDQEWGFLLAAGLGIPEVSLVPSGVVGDLADCTADFRDQYYGLAPYVRESPVAEPGDTHLGLAPLVTSGLIDPAVCHWGTRGTRFLKQAWVAPVIDLYALADDAPLSAWARRRLVPKLLVATQGRVLEAVADPDGRWLPSVPVVTVQPRAPEDLWRLLAVLLAPPVCALAATRYAGSALNPSAIKLSARQVAALPLPSAEEAWAAGARQVRAAQEGLTPDERSGHLHAAAAAMCSAYDVHGEPADELVRWWVARLPGR